MAAVEDRHIVLLRHLVDGRKKADEVLPGVDVLLAVGAQEEVFALLETESFMNVRGFYLREVVVQYFSHRGTRDISPLLRKAAVGKVAPGVLGIGHIHIGDDVHYAAVGLLGEALVLAAVAGLHMEDRDMETLGPDDAEAAVGVAEHEDCVRLGGYHKLV